MRKKSKRKAQPVSVSYNKDLDILIVELQDGSNSYGEESEEYGERFITFRDMDTDEVTGYQLMDFQNSWKAGIVSDFPWKEGENFCFEKDVLPLIKRRVNLQEEVE